jgi:hypothetical protein
VKLAVLTVAACPSEEATDQVDLCNDSHLSLGADANGRFLRESPQNKSNSNAEIRGGCSLRFSAYRITRKSNPFFSCLVTKNDLFRLRYTEITARQQPHSANAGQ